MRQAVGRLGVAAALLLGGLLQAQAEAVCGQDPEDPPVSVDAPTLVVTLAADRAGYRPGQTATLPVSVHVGRPDGPKASGAHVMITVLSGSQRVVKLYADTDARGTARPGFAVTRHTPKGPLTATATARLEAVGSYDCSGALVYQYGETSVDPLARIG